MAMESSRSLAQFLLRSGSFAAGGLAAQAIWVPSLGSTTECLGQPRLPDLGPRTTQKLTHVRDPVSGKAYGLQLDSPWSVFSFTSVAAILFKNSVLQVSLAMHSYLDSIRVIEEAAMERDEELEEWPPFPWDQLKTRLLYFGLPASWREVAVKCLQRFFANALLKLGQVRRVAKLTKGIAKSAEAKWGRGLRGPQLGWAVAQTSCRGNILHYVSDFIYACTCDVVRVTLMDKDAVRATNVKVWGSKAYNGPYDILRRAQLVTVYFSFHAARCVVSLAAGSIGAGFWAMSGRGGTDWAFTILDLVAYYGATEPAITRIFDGKRLTREEVSLLLLGLGFVQLACRGLYYAPCAPMRAPALGWTSPPTITFKYL